MKVDTSATFLANGVIPTWVVIAEAAGLWNTDGMFSVLSASVRQSHVALKYVFVQLSFH